MLTGTARPEVLAEDAPELESFATEPVSLVGVETLQILTEIESEGADRLLPPGLHPTVPPIATWWVQSVSESPWGAFRLAQCRVECRSGLRPRGFLRHGFIDSAEAGRVLTSRWGYALTRGEIALDRSYDRIEATVRDGSGSILELQLEDPVPLRAQDAYYVANMHLAHTPNGLRLVQVDPEFEVERAERGRASIRRFDAAAWRGEGIRPSDPVSALFSTGNVTLPALRYVCRPDVLAFQGTERVDTQASEGVPWAPR